MDRHDKILFFSRGFFLGIIVALVCALASLVARAAPTPEQIAAWQFKMPMKKTAPTSTPIMTPPPRVEPIQTPEPQFTKESEFFNHGVSR